MTIIRGDARRLPLADASVDLICTSPPYWALRSYTDGGAHYDGQIGAEPTPAAYIASLIDCTREWMRVLKPSGSMWINLGDKYSRPGGGVDKKARNLDGAGRGTTGRQFASAAGWEGPAEKSLIGLPWRYALACIDELGLILRAEVIWEKKNGLPESVTDRVRRNHEQWFHFVKKPRYYSAVDAIREPHAPWTLKAYAYEQKNGGYNRRVNPNRVDEGDASDYAVANPLGKLPGSVWSDQRVSDGSDLIRCILEAVAAGAITADEGERLWTGQSTSCATLPNPKTGAGNGPDIELMPVTERSPSSALGARTSPTESATGCSSDPSPTASPSTTCAETPDASGLTTSRQSRCGRTSAEPTLSAPSASTGTPSPTPTSTSPRQGSPTRSAVPASSRGSDVGESVWQVATQPLKVPAHLGIDHFAAYPLELPRRIIQGWSPSGICTACGEGRRQVVAKTATATRSDRSTSWIVGSADHRGGNTSMDRVCEIGITATITGEACACPDTSAPTRPAVVLDPFGGTGTTALVADALGRHGISVDMSADYCRLAAWRTTDPGQRAAALQVEKPAVQMDGQTDLLTLLGGG